jgi:hypothetical protein
MTDERLEQRLRAALPPTEDVSPRTDGWPALARRLDEKPRWSVLDVSLGVAAAVALLLLPERLWLLVYHL